MHTLFLLASLLLAVALGGVAVLALRSAPVGARRPLALTVLAAPPFVLALATFHILPPFWTECAPLVGWDRVASIGLLLVLGAVAGGAVILNLARDFLVERLLAACPPLADPDLASRIGRLAQGLALAPPTLRVLDIEAPLAVTGGLRRPAILLSRWLVDHLDERELDAVLAHEIAHLARRDHLTRWLARLLRDAMPYLPASWYALRVLQTDEEFEADALAVEVTGRPVAMASALGKVWQQALAAPAPIGLARLPGYAAASAALLEARLARLLENRARRGPAREGKLLAGVVVVAIGQLTPRLLAVGSALLPLSCHLRPL